MLVLSKDTEIISVIKYYKFRDFDGIEIIIIKWIDQKVKWKY
jgi:hypothetical protein